jgi:hypothetical protein
MEAPELEGDVAYCQDLVHDQHVGDHMDGDGEAQSHEHAA